MRLHSKQKLNNIIKPKFMPKAFCGAVSFVQPQHQVVYVA